MLNQGHRTNYEMGNLWRRRLRAGQQYMVTVHKKNGNKWQSRQKLSVFVGSKNGSNIFLFASERALVCSPSLIAIYTLLPVSLSTSPSNYWALGSKHHTEHRQPQGPLLPSSPLLLFILQLPQQLQLLSPSPPPPQPLYHQIANLSD